MSAGHFDWQETVDGHPDPLEVYLAFGDNCLLLGTATHNLATFPLPSRNSTPTKLSNNGWTITPASGAYFFARPSVSCGHIFPQAPPVFDPSALCGPCLKVEENLRSEEWQRGQ